MHAADATETRPPPGAHDDDRRLAALQQEVARLRGELEQVHVQALAESLTSQRDRMLLRAFMDRSDMMAWLKDERGTLTYANRNWFEQFGFHEADALGRTDFDLFPREQATQFRTGDLEVLGGHDLVRSIERTIDHEGRLHYWQVTRFPFHNSVGERFVGGLAYDATDRVRSDEEIRRLAITDVLTGLLNRRGFFLLAEPELLRSRRRGSVCTIIFIDLDGLKSVNDRLGHQAGDEIIKLTGLILKKAFRDTDIVARLGGDEFAVFAADTTSDVDVIRTRLRKVMDDLSTNPILKAQLSFSIGLLPCDPEQTQSMDALLAEADELMYTQKRAKRGK